MAINGSSYNPFLYENAKITSNFNKDPHLKPQKNILADPIQDTFEFSNENSENNELLSLELKDELKETKTKQGLIGKLWDGFKNITHIGVGSNKVKQAIEDFENGKISQEEASEMVAKYKDGQKQSVDMIADIASGIASFGAFAFATGIGIAATPFTGGASLGLAVAGFSIAGVAGAGVKVGIKGVDSLVGGRKYDSAGYDLATGGINGIFAPITAGIGGAVGKTIAGKLGVNALREGGEVVVQEAIKGTIKGVITKTLLTTNVKYVGGTIGARALVMGADMAANGAITGAIDSGTRYLAGNNEDKSIEGFSKEVGAGTIGGLIMSPVVGGGMKLVGNGIGKLTSKLQAKVSTNYSQAKKAMTNVPSVDNPDMEVAKEFGSVFKQAQGLVDNVQIKGSELLDGLDNTLFELSENISGIVKNISALNAEIDSLSKENKKLAMEALKEFSEGKDVSSKMFELSQKAIALTDMVDGKIGTLSNELEEKLGKIMTANEVLTQKAASGIELASQTLGDANDVANKTIEQVKKIPDTSIYKQLGDLPERTKTLYSSLTSDVASLDNVAKVAREKILNGDIQEGLSDLVKYYSEVDIFNEKLEKQIMSMQSSAARSGIEESFNTLKERLTRLTSTADFKNMPREKQVQAIVENSNILFSKFAQTFSSDNNLPPEIQNILKQFTSNCTGVREISQAQSLADELYGVGKYKILKSFGAGTIGETYLAQTADNANVVIKMLKEGVTPEKFAQDRAMFTKYINEFVKDGAEKEYKLNLINSMFDAWDNELNFGLEAQGAKSLADGAKRFSVAQTLEVGSKNGQNISLVMEKANGVKLDSLLEMIKLYKENPSEYFVKYAKEINDYPALKTPENWMSDLGIVYQKAQNEQAMFVGQNGTRTIHADPHPGNVFVDFDTTSKPKIIYIDTGNVVNRTNSQTLQDIALSLNMMIGNSQGIAEAMLNGATLPDGADSSKIAQKFAKLLDERLYKAGVNLKSTQYTQNVINGIMKELNVVADSGNSNLMKATLQRIETSRAINGVCGTASSKAVDIKDLAFGIIKSFKVNPKETWQTIKPIMKWAYKNNDQTMITFFQMIIKNSEVQNAVSIS